MLVQARDRVYSDFLMRSRLGLYRALLETALGAGYEVISVERLWRQISGPGLDPDRRLLVLRHDVDTDPGTAGVMWGIDRELGVKSSYHFRLSTIAEGLMADIASGGGDASYHYEEIATVAKRHGLAARADVEAHMPEAQAEFARNLEHLRSITGLPMPVVSAHGDFVNRRLGTPNWMLLADADFRRQVGLEAEAYDPDLIGSLTSKHTDVPYPQFWMPADPLVAIQRGDAVVYILVHPRHWHVDRLGNLRDDIRRAVEGARYGLATRQRGLA